MTIRGIVFDIGGVLKYIPDLGINAKWENLLKLQPGDLDKQLVSVWHGGTLGTMTEQEVHKNIGEIMDMDEAQVNAFMDDVWIEYLGTHNVELTNYFRDLRPKFQTAILSNSFVGAREREQAAYQFGNICDLIIYSHEVGLCKPDPQIYALTCERLGLPPVEVIFLDDRDQAIEVACAFGIHGIVFKDNTQAIADIEACIRANA